MTYQPSRRAVLGFAGAAGATGAIAAFAGAAGASGRATGDGIPAGLKPGGELDRFATDLAAKDQFSGSFLVTHRGRTVLARSYGMANRDLSIPNGPDTIFGLASVTKLLTGVAIGKLVQDRKLAYTDRLGQHVPGFPSEIAETVSIHHLLTHTSGLGDFMQTRAYQDAQQSWTTEQAVRDGCTDIIRQSTLAFPPGSRHLYSNSAYHLLGEIVTNASGQSLSDYLRENVFRRAGMHDSDFYTRTAWRDDRRIARPYAPPLSGGPRADVLGEHAFVGTGHTGAFATCAGMDRLARALVGNRLLTPAFTQLTLGPKIPVGKVIGPPGGGVPTPVPGIGFKTYCGMANLDDANQWSYWMDGGSTGGESTDYAVYPDQGWVCVVLGNYELGTAQPIAAKARTLINGG
jgi:CubicO group peptidase (beta-lactamase class C family)